MNGYAAAVRQFYDIYRPIARRYGLRMSSHTSIYDDGWIKYTRAKEQTDNRSSRLKKRTTQTYTTGQGKR